MSAAQASGLTQERVQKATVEVGGKRLPGLFSLPRAFPITNIVTVAKLESDSFLTLLKEKGLQTGQDTKPPTAATSVRTFTVFILCANCIFQKKSAKPKLKTVKKESTK